MNSNRAAVNILCEPFGMNTCYLNSLKSLSPPVLPPPPSPSTHPLHSFCFHSAACWEQESCEFRLYRLASICCRSWAAYWELLLSCLHLFSKQPTYTLRFSELPPLCPIASLRGKADMNFSVVSGLIVQNMKRAAHMCLWLDGFTATV